MTVGFWIVTYSSVTVSRVVASRTPVSYAIVPDVMTLTWISPSPTAVGTHTNDCIRLVLSDVQANGNADE